MGPLKLQPKITKVTPEVGVAGVRKTWEFVQQLVKDKEKHRAMADDLATFFRDEQVRISRELDKGE